MLTNAHRSLLLVLALLVLAAPASAAEVVRIDGWRLDARDDKPTGFCLRLEASLFGVAEPELALERR